MSTGTVCKRRSVANRKGAGMQGVRVLKRPAGVGRLVRRLERERRAWSRPAEAEIPTAQAWRAGVAEGIRLAQVAIRKGA